MAKTKLDGGGSRGKKKGGIDLPKFASEVSRNYAKGVAHVGRQLDKAIKSRPASRTVTNTMRHSATNRAAIKKITGR